jgi:hypothetical protein
MNKYQQVKEETERTVIANIFIILFLAIIAVAILNG